MQINLVPNKRMQIPADTKLSISSMSYGRGHTGAKEAS